MQKIPEIYFAFGFFLPSKHPILIMFDPLQRPHLIRTPKRVLIQASQNCLQKRSDFLKAVYNGLQFEDPWMNRNLGNTHLAAVTSGGPLTSTATLNRHHHRKKREDNRQIWTKTLSYPNK